MLHRCKLLTRFLSLHNIARITFNAVAFYYVAALFAHWTWYNLDLMLLKWLRLGFIFVVVSQNIWHFSYFSFFALRHYMLESSASAGVQSALEATWYLWRKANLEANSLRKSGSQLKLPTITWIFLSCCLVCVCIIRWLHSFFKRFTLFAEPTAGLFSVFIIVNWFLVELYSGTTAASKLAKLLNYAFWLILLCKVTLS